MSEARDVIRPGTRHGRGLTPDGQLDLSDLLDSTDAMNHLGPPSIWTSPAAFITAFSVFVVPYVIAAVWFSVHMRSKRVQSRSSIVLVLGDFGRSPRMMYHAQSLVEHGWDAYVVAYGDTPPVASLLDSGMGQAAEAGGRKGKDGSEKEIGDEPGDRMGRCHFHYLSSLKRVLTLGLPWPVRAAIRLAHQCVAVLWIIWIEIPVHTEYIVVQTPPAIPTLFLVQVAAMVSGSKVVVDWHNTGYSVLAQRLGRLRPVMGLAKTLERMTGRDAYAHLFVSDAMKRELSADFELEGRMEVLHDRPPKQFRRTTPSERAELFQRLGSELALPSAFEMDKGKVVISSTSWTADEDFTPLLTALETYEAAATALSRSSPSSLPETGSSVPGHKLPPLLVLITGKGPLRAPFERSVARRSFTHVVVRCLFVPAADYPTLLGCADLGLSFHASTSGTDLPMKIVDMLGCGVPVLAKGYRTLGELVRDGKEGRWFDTAEQLANLMVEHMADTAKIDALRANIEDMKRWEDNWDEVVYQRLLYPVSDRATT